MDLFAKALGMSALPMLNFWMSLSIIPPCCKALVSKYSPPLPGPPATPMRIPFKSCTLLIEPLAIRSARAMRAVGLFSIGSRPPGAIIRRSRPRLQPFQREVTIAIPPTSILPSDKKAIASVPDFTRRSVTSRPYFSNSFRL